MSFLVDVIVPGPWWNQLTYRCEENLSAGSRVRVPLGRGTRIAFVSHFPSEESTSPPTIRKISEVLDISPVFPASLWDLSNWIGETFLCGQGTALGDMLPPDVLKGATYDALCFEKTSGGVSRTTDSVVFTPRDEDRFEEYRRMIRRTDGVCLVLFPEGETARRFYASLDGKDDVLLWPNGGGRRAMQAWDSARRSIPRVVLGAPGVCYAPLPRIDLVIIEDESASSYDSQKFPFLNYRMIAARRARDHGAQLVLGGRMPSARAFQRYRPPCPERPGSRLVLIRKNAALHKATLGIDKDLPVGHAIVRMTERMLRESQVSLWILDRLGYAVGIRCDDCGAAIACTRCGGALRWKERDAVATCMQCRLNVAVPERCPSCGGVLLIGERPGTEALRNIAARCSGNPQVVECVAEDFSVVSRRKSIEKRVSDGAILIGTRGILPFCDTLSVGLVCWIDPEVELGFSRYYGAVLLFSMIWESCWRGPGAEKRKVLVQTSETGAKWIRGARQGWGAFWDEELRERKLMMLPPYQMHYEIEAPPVVRSSVLESLRHANIDVIPWSEENERALVVGVGLRTMKKAMERFFSIKASGLGFPRIRVRME